MTTKEREKILAQVAEQVSLWNEFRTDDFQDRDFKNPEEIRKANLCGADLRGALLEGVDFYLVDLRGALYDPEQEEHLRRSGAILAGFQAGPAKHGRPDPAHDGRYSDRHRTFRLERSRRAVYSVLAQ